MAMRRKYNQKPCQKQGHLLVENIPAKVLMDLMDILDINENWKMFAAELKYKMLEISRLELCERHGQSPSKAILIDWFGRSPTVLDLQSILMRMNLANALAIIQDYVPSSHNFGPRPDDPSFVVNSETDGNGFHSSVRQPREFVHQPTAGHRFEGTPRPHPHTRQPYPSSQFTSPPPPPYQGIDPAYHGGLSPSYHNTTRYMGDRRVHSPKPENELSMDTKKDLASSTSMTSFYSEDGKSLDHRDRQVRNEVLRKTTIFTYEQLATATNNFSATNIIGQGGFGIVYRGELRNTKIAIKEMKRTDQPGENTQQALDSFLTELVNLSLCTHRNIVPLVGICFEPKCILHEFMVHGSLEDRLQCKNGTLPLSWRIRQQILVGASQGLEYLHAQNPPLVHGDIKSANILLDDYMEAKLSDFGQARQATRSSSSTGQTHVILDQRENFPLSEAYIPEDVFLGDTIILGIKTDTFSFGVVIFEVCSGLKPVDDGRDYDDRLLKNYVLNLSDDISTRPLQKEKDQNAADWPDDIFLVLGKYALKCANHKPNKRPLMKQIRDELQRIQILANDRYPPSCLSSSENSSRAMGPSETSDISSSPDRSFNMKYSSDGDYNSNLLLHPPSTSVPSLSDSLRLEIIPPRHEPPNLASLEKFVEDFDGNLDQPSSSVGQKDIGDPIKNQSFELNTKNILTTDEHVSTQPMSLPVQSSCKYNNSELLERFGQMSVCQDASPEHRSVPLQLQIEHDMRKQRHLSSDSNINVLENGKVPFEGEGSSGTSWSGEACGGSAGSSYKAEYEHHQKLQKKSIDSLVSLAVSEETDKCSVGDGNNPDSNQRNCSLDGSVFIHSGEQPLDLSVRAGPRSFPSSLKVPSPKPRISSSNVNDIKQQNVQISTFGVNPEENKATPNFEGAQFVRDDHKINSDNNGAHSSIESEDRERIQKLHRLQEKARQSIQGDQS